MKTIAFLILISSLQISNTQMFIYEIDKHTFETHYNTPILPSITIAQGIIESGYGKCYLSKNYNNIFGIKTTKKDTNKVLLFGKEKNGKRKSYFKTFESKEKCIDYRVLLLTQSKRYKDIHKYTNVVSQLIFLNRVGYFADSRYILKILKCISIYNLECYDYNIYTISNNFLYNYL